MATTPVVVATTPVVHKTPPAVLAEPLIYLSSAQREVCAANAQLSALVPHLPGWVPARFIGLALGHGPGGVDLAVASLEGRAYLWATEFENVHSTWRFTEPAVNAGGQDSEAYFQAQKPPVFDAATTLEWNGRRVGVMRDAVRMKFAASQSARELLLSTHPHPLLSVKNDKFWGFDAKEGGRNMLAVLLMELRAELLGNPGGALTTTWITEDPTARAATTRLLHYAKELRAIYLPRFQPPQWVDVWIAAGGNAAGGYSAMAQRSACYFPRRMGGVEKGAEASKLLHERQPVNIAMRAGHEEGKMEAVFGFGGSRGSGYSSLSGQDSLPANIAVYVHTPVGSASGPLAHVINSVGFGLDDATQPDARYFLQGAAFRSAQRKAEFAARLQVMFRLVFACARDLGVHRACLAFVGGGVFSSLYPGGVAAYFAEAFLPALEAALDEHAPAAAACTHVSIFPMGAGSEPLLERVRAAVEARGLRFSPEPRFVPAALDSPDTLYQNAWDPHSICGNGNGGDNSLDGYFGRSTAIGALSFPPLNPWIRMRPVDTES